MNKNALQSCWSIGVRGCVQDAVRGDFIEVSKLLIDRGAKVLHDGKVCMLIDLIAICCHLSVSHEDYCASASTPCIASSCIAWRESSCAAERAGCGVLAQLVDLAHSHLSGKMQDIPDNILDLDPDWEIDPDALVLLEKIGSPPNTFYIVVLPCSAKILLIPKFTLSQGSLSMPRMCRHRCLLLRLVARLAFGGIRVY